MIPRSLWFEELSIGLSEKIIHTVSERDINLFAEVSGDRNPIHLDADFAATSQFGERIAHGMLSAGFISSVIGMRLPGPGSIYLSQSLKFLAPVKIGDKVETSVRVISLNHERCRATLDCLCVVNGNPILEGEAVVKVPSRPLEKI